MKFIGLVFAIIAIVSTLRTAQAQSVPWPSISPSYRCDDGLATFTLANVGADMTQGSTWQVRTPTRLIERGVFWIVSGGVSEWRYNAPHIELTFTYLRPDNWQPVSLTQTCEGVSQPEWAQGHQWYFPLVTTL